MPINPEEASTISVGQLAPAAWAMADMLPHEVNAFLKKGSVQGLADLIKAYIGTASSLAFNPTTVPDGGTLPTTSTSEWMLVGKGTFNNVGGASNITTTEELNALTSVGDYWTLAVEIPIDFELAGIVQTIRSGFTTTTPSENAVYDALALKANTDDIPDISGKENTANKQNSLDVDGSGVKFPTVDTVNETVTTLKDNIDLKLNIADYNQYFQGKYSSLIALEAAKPTGKSGDYAIVDSGSGEEAKEYIWDTEDGWVPSSSASASTTDALPEGSINLYFTSARVLATILTGISFATGTPVTAADSILIMAGKLQKQITDILASITAILIPQITLTTSVSITTSTTDTSGYGQKGRNVIIDNGSNAINITVDGGADFAASYLKHGTGTITFVQGSGRTLALVDGTAALNGLVGSTATISSVGTKDYLRISNAIL